MQYANSTTQRCSKEIMKTFLIEDFFHLPPVSTTPVVHLELRISNFRKNSKRPLWYNQGLGRNCSMQKTQSQKTRGTVPLNYTNIKYTAYLYIQIYTAYKIAARKQIFAVSLVIQTRVRLVLATILSQLHNMLNRPLYAS